MGKRSNAHHRSSKTGSDSNGNYAQETVHIQPNKHAKRVNAHTRNTKGMEKSRTPLVKPDNPNDRAKSYRPNSLLSPHHQLF